MSDMTHKTVPVEPIIANLPKAIWLNVGELDPLDAPYDFDEINSHEDCVTWCDVPQDGFDIKYVRADLAEAAQPSPVTELEVMLAKALSFYADPTRYHGPNQTLEKPDEWTDKAGLSVYRLDVTRDQGIIARAALAAYEAKKAAPTNYQKHLAVRAEIEGRSHDD